MAGIANLIQRMDAMSRPRFVFSGHGHWSRADGLIKVPARTRVCFYVRHGLPLCNPPSFDIDRGEFNPEGILIGRQGGEHLIHPVRVYEGGDDVANYTLSTRNELAKAETRVRQASGGAVKGKKRFDIRFGNTSHDTTFITGNMQLSDIFANEKYLGADLHWAACRVETA